MARSRPHDAYASHKADAYASPKADAYASPKADAYASPKADAPASPTADEIVAAHRSDDAGDLFGIAELCRDFGISPRAIRFYEDKGLLAPRRVNGTRVYTRRDKARLQLILRAKAIGSSLAEIKHYLDLYGAHGEGRTRQMKYVFERTSQAIAELELKRSHIDATLAELRVINSAVRRSLDAR